jgi:hypothetical protein
MARQGAEGARWLRLSSSMDSRRFDIVLRNIESTSEDVAAAVASAVEALRSQGFANYFGLQRFGTGGTPTHRQGAALTCEEGDLRARCFAALRGWFPAVCQQLASSLAAVLDLQGGRGAAPRRVAGGCPDAAHPPRGRREQQRQRRGGQPRIR